MAAYIVALTTMFAFGGCAKEEDTSSCEWEKEYNTYLQKANAYASNPISSNCVAMKNAVLAFANKVDGCAAGKISAEVKASLNSSKEAVKSLSCN